MMLLVLKIQSDQDVDGEVEPPRRLDRKIGAIIFQIGLAMLLKQKPIVPISTTFWKISQLVKREQLPTTPFDSQNQ